MLDRRHSLCGKARETNHFGIYANGTVSHALRKASRAARGDAALSKVLRTQDSNPKRALKQLLARFGKCPNPPLRARRSFCGLRHGIGAGSRDPAPKRRVSVDS